MATAAALLLLLLPLLRVPPSARGFSLPLQHPGDCGDARYFDISQLSCGPCGAHQRRSAGGERGGHEWRCGGGERNQSTERLGLEGSLKPIELQPPAVGKDAAQQLRLPGAPPTWPSAPPGMGQPQVCGQLCQRLTAL